MKKSKSGRLLIVDDESDLLTSLCDILSEIGYETKGFTSGKDALKALNEQDFDLLLTDLMMPEMDGIALLQAALEIDPSCRHHYNRAGHDSYCGRSDKGRGI